jgi:predicted  nucleic acid-binding Zn-ribbon protein
MFMFIGFFLFLASAAVVVHTVMPSIVQYTAGPSRDRVAELENIMKLKIDDTELIEARKILQRDLDELSRELELKLPKREVDFYVRNALDDVLKQSSNPVEVVVAKQLARELETGALKALKTDLDTKISAVVDKVSAISSNSSGGSSGSSGTNKADIEDAVRRIFGEASADVNGVFGKIIDTKTLPKFNSMSVAFDALAKAVNAIDPKVTGVSNAMNTTIMNLSNKINALDPRLNDVKSVLSADIALLKSAVSDVDPKMYALQKKLGDDLGALANKMQALEYLLSTSRSSSGEIMQKATDVAAQLATLQTQMSAIDPAITALQDKIFISIAKISRDILSLDARVVGVDNKVGVLDTTIQKNQNGLSASIRDILNVIGALQKDSIAHSSAEGVLDDSVRSALLQVKKLGDNITAISQTVASQTNQLQGLDPKILAVQNTLQSNLDKLQGSLQTLDPRVAGLESIVASFDPKIMQLQQKIAVDLDAIRQQIKSATTTATTSTSTTPTVQTVQATPAVTASSISPELFQQISDMNVLLAGTQTRVTSVESILKNILTPLSSDVASIDSRLSALQTYTAGIDPAIASLKTYAETNIVNLTKAVSALDPKVTGVANALTTATTNMQTSLNAIANRVATLEASNQKLGAQIDSVTMATTATQNSLASAISRLTANEASTQKLNTDVSGISGLVNSLTTTVKDTVTRLTSSEASAQKLSADQGLVKTALTDLSAFAKAEIANIKNSIGIISPNMSKADVTALINSLVFDTANAAEKTINATSLKVGRFLSAKNLQIAGDNDAGWGSLFLGWENGKTYLGNNAYGKHSLAQAVVGHGIHILNTLYAWMGLEVKGTLNVDGEVHAKWFTSDTTMWAPKVYGDIMRTPHISGYETAPGKNDGDLYAGWFGKRTNLGNWQSGEEANVYKLPANTVSTSNPLYMLAHNNYVSRHLDASKTWNNDGGSSLFLGWNTGKTIIGGPTDASGALTLNLDAKAGPIPAGTIHMASPTYFWNDIISDKNITTNYINAKTGFETAGSVQAIGNLVANGSVVSRKGELCLGDTCMDQKRVAWGTNETPWDLLSFGTNNYLITRINSDGNAECGSDDSKNCVQGTADVVNKYKIAKPRWANALMCGDHHKSVYGSTGYEVAGHWCNTTLTKFGRKVPTF